MLLCSGETSNSKAKAMELLSQHAQSQGQQGTADNVFFQVSPTLHPCHPACSLLNHAFSPVTLPLAILLSGSLWC